MKDSELATGEPGNQETSRDDVLPASTDPVVEKHRRRIKSFVRRQARQTDAQERAFRDLGPRFILDFAGLVASGQALDAQAVFGNSNPVILEIGFGMGHATALIAKANPEVNYLCAEVHTPGVGALLDRIEQGGITNIRIIHWDVVEFLDRSCPPGLFSGVHVFFPDPWPKKKHHKRRLIQTPFLDFLAPFCRQDAYLYMVTDWEEYALWMLEALQASSAWNNTCTDWTPPAEWRPRTAFEGKGLAKNHVIREIVANRQPASAGLEE